MFDGTIDEVRISDIARDSAWIKASYETQIDDLLDFGGEDQGATSPGPIMLCYGEGTVQTPRYRTWNGIDWSGELSASSVGGTTQWAVLKAHPSKAEAILGVLDDSGHVNVQVWDGDSWGTPLEVTTSIGTTNDAYRGFDIAYEQFSGDAVIVYSIGGDDPEYRVWNGSSWSDPDTADLLTGGTVMWVTLVPKPSSNVIMLVTFDGGSDVSAAVWDGSQFGDSINLATSGSATNYEPLDAAWEGSSGHGLVAWQDSSGGSGYIYYNTWDGSQWGSSTQGPSVGAGHAPRFVRLAPNPSSDTVLLAAAFKWTSKSNLYANLWDGSGWGSYTTIESDGMEDGGRRCFDMAFESSGSQAILGWADWEVHTLDYRTWTSGSGWSAPLTGPNLGNDIKLVQLRADPNSDEIMLGTITDDSDLQLTLWTGSAWGTVNEADTSTSSQQFMPYMIAYRKGAVNLAWIYPTSASIWGFYSSPIIRSGRVYIGSDDANLYCLSASDGSLIWYYATGYNLRSSPSAAYESGEWVIYFGSDDGYVYAVKDTGSSYEVKWTKNLGVSTRSSPALWDSLLYIGSNDDSVHCLRTSDGSQKWATYLYGDISSSPTVFNDVVYVGSYSDTLYALNHLDGTILRTYGVCGDIVAPPFVTWQTGKLCIGSYASATAGSDTMYVINASNFSTYWKFADSGNLARIYTSAWCFPFTTKVDFGSDNDYFYSIDISDSSLVYKYDTGGDVRSSPLSWSGVTYFGSNSDKFYALDDSQQEPPAGWPYMTNGDVESSPAISLSSNIVVVGSSDGHVYAFILE